MAAIHWESLPCTSQNETNWNSYFRQKYITQIVEVFLSRTSQSKKNSIPIFGMFATSFALEYIIIWLIVKSSFEWSASLFFVCTVRNAMAHSLIHSPIHVPFNFSIPEQSTTCLRINHKNVCLFFFIKQHKVDTRSSYKDSRTIK